METYLWYALWCGIVLCITWEMLAPRRQAGKQTSYRWLNNGLLTLLNIFLGRWFYALLLAGVASLSFDHKIGLVGAWSIGFWGGLLLAFVVFELLDYWLHRAFHASSYLWRFHAVHHSDTDLDFSSAYRHHPFEVLLTIFLHLPIVLVLGLPPAAILVYQLFRNFMAVFSHSNIYLPLSVDRVLRCFVVTPDFHRTHHSSERTYTNSNYSSSVSWPDYIFRTIRLRDFAEQADFELGLEYLRSPEDSRTDRLLLLPFRWPGASINRSVLSPEDTSKITPER
ncbi:sterol desaturase family protein [Gilvimarinus sp. SDUM040013]|uniref:Sterol desaturase family protein n=1 Tax=Gilvimarinus gilvus TaxID=3058038 RepID=A0ABU4RVT6_9GAMM|nr:sterol desaturase family protein [Gilvimarinus sp. SDUM040013]MDO3388268.1 sterol desaturase family protein [Gilvimarinus sp. SDUM040013]MDX6847818.1 sterol desaturase family protein [Gilvimarinus sp. SDUM040013]